MTFLHKTPLALAALISIASGAQAGVNVPVTQTCDTSRALSAYVAGTTTSTATLPFLVGGPAKMTPCFIETDLGSSEPSLSILKDGTVVYSPVHFPNGDIAMMRSKDNGSTWDATVPLLPSGKPHSRVQPYAYVDPETDRIFFTTSRASFVPIVIKTGIDMNISDDGGDTWRYTLVDQFKGLDWIKINQGKGNVSGASKVMYLSGPTPISTPAVIVTPKTHQVLKSTDGGVTWAEAGGFPIGLAANNCSLTDYILFGASTVTADGTIRIAGRRCTKVAIATSSDEGKTWSVADVPNTKLIAGGTTASIPFNPNYVLTQPITADDQGNLYVIYPDDKNLLRLTVSRDKGKTWSTPVVISAPNIKRTHLASMTVKEPGKIAIAYYGSESDKQSGSYSAYVAESSNAFSAKPAFKSQMINAPSDPTMAGGFDANYFGMFVGGDLAEITQIKYAPNGDLFVSLTKDMCPNGTSKCNWDFDAHLKSKFKAIVGRITH
jgi:hypothetical protein